MDVTTQDPGVEALRNTGGSDTQWGIRAAIGGFSAVLPISGSGAVGVAHLGSFSASFDDPCFIFPKEYTSSSSNAYANKGIAETISHEVGHTLNLVHDGDSFSQYYGGHGTGVTSWAPIMGNSDTTNLLSGAMGAILMLKITIQVHQAPILRTTLPLSPPPMDLATELMMSATL